MNSLLSLYLVDRSQVTEVNSKQSAINTIFLWSFSVLFVGTILFPIYSNDVLNSSSNRSYYSFY